MAMATRALPTDVPVGAVIVSEKGHILGEGWNTREQDRDLTGHAEIMALRAACKTVGNWRLDGSTVYVTLEPCPMCASALIQARVARVVFGAADALQGAMGSALNLTTLSAKPPQVKGGVLEDACRTQLAQFFQTLRQE